MNKYKIKINCTHPDNLRIDDRVISKNRRLYNYIRSKMQLENIGYITKMLIVYKTDSNEFILFIVKMKDAGFFSLNNRDIKFIDTTPIKPITIFNRNFGSLVKVEIIPNGNFPNTSTYTGGVIYER
jgi:hypothetical protein